MGGRRWRAPFFFLFMKTGNDNVGAIGAKPPLHAMHSLPTCCQRRPASGVGQMGQMGQSLHCTQAASEVGRTGQSLHCTRWDRWGKASNQVSNGHADVSTRGPDTSRYTRHAFSSASRFSCSHLVFGNRFGSQALHGPLLPHFLHQCCRAMWSGSAILNPARCMQ